MDKSNVLIIKKENFSNEEYMKTLKVSTELHTKVKQIADSTNRQLSNVACMLVEFALEHTQIED